MSGSDINKNNIQSTRWDSIQKKEWRKSGFSISRITVTSEKQNVEEN
jgi:hypothetical protein